MQHNPMDPLLKSGPEDERRLFESFAGAAAGHDHQVVLGAAINVLINAVRQNCPARGDAERAFDELVGRAKNLLLEQHYDPVTSRRRNVFPHTQIVRAQIVDWGDS